MKFLYTQDVHMKGKNSHYRIGNYYEDMMNKVEEIIKIAKKYKVERIIDGGDFFDSAIVSNIMVDNFVDMVEASKIPLNMLYGNHCMLNANIKNSEGSSLAHIFRRSKLINHLDEIEGSDFFIKGYDYYYGIENGIKEKGLIIKSKAKFKIGIVHAFVTNKPFLPQVQHVQISDIKTNYDLLLHAHYHLPWGIKEIDKTKFVNYGCIGRLSKNEMEIKPTVLIIDTDTKEIKSIKLKNVKSSIEVFDLEKIKLDKENKVDLNNFVESIQNTKIQVLDLKSQAEQICKENKVKEGIKDTIVDRISKFEDKEVL